MVLQVVLDEVWGKLVYVAASGGPLFEVTDPDEPDATTNALPASRVEVVGVDQLELEFNCTAPVKSVLLRYAYRNNVCPPQPVRRQVWGPSFLLPGGNKSCGG